MDKKTFFALMFVVLLFMAIQLLTQPRGTQAAQPQPEQTENTSTTAPADSAAKVPDQTAAVQDTTYLGAPAQAWVTLQNTLVKVKFNTRGAAISSIEPTEYKWADGKTQINLVPEGKDIALTRLTGSQGLPDLTVANWFHHATEKQVVFWLGTDKEKPVAKKTYTLDDKYGITLEVELADAAPATGLDFDFRAGIADSEKIKKETDKDQDYKLLIYHGTKVQRHRPPKLKGGLNDTLSEFKWAAMRSKYFTIAVCDTTGKSGIDRFQASLAGESHNPAIVLQSRINSGESAGLKRNLFIYAGPADYYVMRTYKDTRLEWIPERGASWYKWFANILAWMLRFLHSFIPNYGVVIIIFSIILKILLHPLTHKSMDANLKMQRIQPQVQEIQAKYKSDPKTMQAELSKLYKEAGASPLSGCLPLLLQMPILFALYSVIRYSMDTRHAPFVGWLTDLSQPDRYWILPILMAGFMILQSLMMRPSKQAVEQMDEKQKAMQQSTRMMTWMMPALMLFIFTKVPSGLTLYYTVFTILGVAQQFYLQKHLKNKDLK